MKARRLTGGLTALVGLLAASSALAQKPISLEELERRQAIAEALEPVKQLVIKEHLLDLRPETFHGTPGQLDRPALAVIREMLALDQALRVTTEVGVENLDRLRAQLIEKQSPTEKDLEVSQKAMTELLQLPRAELEEAARTRFTLKYLLEHPRAKATPDPPTPAPEPAARKTAPRLTPEKDWVDGLDTNAETWAPLPDPPGLDRGGPPRAARSAFGEVEAWLRQAWAEKDVVRLGLVGVSFLGLLGLALILLSWRRRRG